MEPVDRLRREIKVLVFDQYGTVVDMQKGLTEVVAPFLERKGWKGDAHRFVTWWRRTHFENSMIDSLCDRGHTPYREIGQRAVSHVMDRAGIAYTRDEVEWLVGRIEALKPFPEAVVGVEEAGYFKPHWKTYAKAEEILGEKQAGILFVANHVFDCVGAKSYGFNTVFIDRRKQPFGPWPEQPDLVVANLKELADALI